MFVADDREVHPVAEVQVPHAVRPGIDDAETVQTACHIHPRPYLAVNHTDVSDGTALPGTLRNDRGGTHGLIPVGREDLLLENQGHLVLFGG